MKEFYLYHMRVDNNKPSICLPGVCCCSVGVLMPFDTFKVISSTIEPRSEKTGLRGFRPGPTQTGLCSHRKCLEA